MKKMITGINWTLFANKNGSTIMNEFFYQLVNKDGRTSEMFKINDTIEILNLYMRSKKKFDEYCDKKFGSLN